MGLPDWATREFFARWVLYLTVLYFSLVQMDDALAASSNLPLIWTASGSWIVSGNCARELNILLVGCFEGEIIPYANLSLADDIGHALLLGLYAIATGRELVLDHAGILNVFLNFLGIYVLAACLIAANLKLTALILVVGGSIICGSFLGVGPHVALIGVSCFALILPIGILLFSYERLGIFLVWIFVGSLLLGLAVLLRQSVGLMGVVLSIFCLVLLGVKRGIDRTYISHFLAVGFAIFLASNSTSAILSLRDLVWDVPETELIDRHGVQHNLFIGLGVVPNTFGVQWSDAYGLEAARLVNPEVQYVSREYYQILGSEYLRLVREDPVEVVRVYFQKGQIFFDSTLVSHFWSGLSVAFAFIFSILFYLLMRRGALLEAGPDMVVFSALTFSAMHLGQAMVFHPSMQYGSPVEILFLIIFASSFEFRSSLRL